MRSLKLSDISRFFISIIALGLAACAGTPAETTDDSTGAYQAAPTAAPEIPPGEYVQPGNDNRPYILTLTKGAGGVVYTWCHSGGCDLGREGTLTTKRETVFGALRSVATLKESDTSVNFDEEDATKNLLRFVFGVQGPTLTLQSIDATSLGPPLVYTRCDKGHEDDGTCS